MYLRNIWGLWSDTKLSKNLHKMEILLPDDITGIILNCYQRKLKNENIRMEEQLKYLSGFLEDNRNACGFNFKNF